jgi:hypothetical protein
MHVVDPPKEIGFLHEFIENPYVVYATIGTIPVNSCSLLKTLTKFDLSVLR